MARWGLPRVKLEAVVLEDLSLSVDASSLAFEVSG